MPAPLISVTDDDLDDLRGRLRRTRWPVEWPAGGWAAGADPREVRRLAEYWASGYDWRKHEAGINALPSRFADIDGTPVHYLRFDAERPGPGHSGAQRPDTQRSDTQRSDTQRSGALPIVLTHGWPSSFLELTELARRLAAPSRYGGSAADAFTVIVPSLPGYTFSPQRPTLGAGTGAGAGAAPGSGEGEQTHELWHRLMRDELGFERYAAHGGDLGAGLSARLGEAHPESVVGIHVLAVASPATYDAASLTADERAYLSSVAAWTAEEGGYQHYLRRQSTMEWKRSKYVNGTDSM